MKRRRTPKPARCPTLVAMHLAPEVELTERQAVLAFRGSYATYENFNILADCRDLLTLAAADRNDAGTLAVCHAAGIALQNIADRYQAKRKFGGSGEELAALDMLIDTSREWWKLQGGEFFRACVTALSRYRADQRVRAA